MNTTTTAAAAKPMTEQEELSSLWGRPDHDWRYVLDVLLMFRVLRKSYLLLPPDEREGIDPAHLRFLGFDGSQEGEYLGVARVLIEEQGLFPESRVNIACDGLDSHLPANFFYRPMLKVWRPLRGHEFLSRQMLVDVIAAKLAPQP